MATSLRRPRAAQLGVGPGRPAAARPRSAWNQALPTCPPPRARTTSCTAPDPRYAAGRAGQGASSSSPVTTGCCAAAPDGASPTGRCRPMRRFSLLAVTDGFGTVTDLPAAVVRTRIPPPIASACPRWHDSNAVVAPEGEVGFAACIRRVGTLPPRRWRSTTGRLCSPRCRPAVRRATGVPNRRHSPNWRMILPRPADTGGRGSDVDTTTSSRSTTPMDTWSVTTSSARSPIVFDQPGKDALCSRGAVRSSRKLLRRRTRMAQRWVESPRPPSAMPITRHGEAGHDQHRRGRPGTRRGSADAAVALTPPYQAKREETVPRLGVTAPDRPPLVTPAVEGWSSLAAACWQ